MIIFQNIFYLKIYLNNIFLFFKIYFTYQQIKMVFLPYLRKLGSSNQYITSEELNLANQEVHIMAYALQNWLDWELLTQRVWMPTVARLAFPSKRFVSLQLYNNALDCLLQTGFSAII